MGVLFDVSLWRRARPIVREQIINGPGQLQTHVWQVDGESGVAVIEKRNRGAFLSFRIEDKAFGRVVGEVKRRRTRFMKKHGGEYDLLA